MTRNWRLLTLAIVMAVAGPASAEEVPWLAAAAAQPGQSTETTCPTERFPFCTATIWNCTVDTAPCKCEGPARQFMDKLLAEFRRVFNEGDLKRAELIAEFACKLEPDCPAAQKAKSLVAFAMQVQPGADGTEECETAAKCVCGEKCACPSAAECTCEKCDENCACRTKDQPASPPCERAEVNNGGANKRWLVVVKQSGFTACADRATFVEGDCGNKPQQILLEGNVDLYQSHTGQIRRTLADRVLINMRDGSCEVLPPKEAQSSKPILKTLPTIKPGIDVVPTPAERGWR
jgi:hypothetical protein